MHLMEQHLGAAGGFSGFIAVLQGVNGERGAGHQIGRDLIDKGFSVVDGEMLLAPGSALAPLLAVVKCQVLGIAPHAVAVHSG